MTLLRIAWFELQNRLKALSTYVYFFIFFAIGLFWMSIAGGTFANASVDFGAGGKVPINAPFAVAFLSMIGGYLGTIITAAISGRATYQDIEYRTTSLFFTAPISHKDYLGGRYLGAFLSMLVLYPGISLGALVAVHAPFIDASRVGPNTWSAYLAPYATLLLPNLFFTSALFFSLAALVRRMLPVYVGAIVLVLGYLIATSLISNIENRTIAAMLDPFGGTALNEITEYWTIAEKSRRLVPLTGVFLWNRALWVGVGVALLGLTYARFSFSERTSSASPKKEEISAGPTRIHFAEPTLDFSTRASVSALWELTRLQWKETVKNVFFFVIVLAGVLFVVAAGSNADQVYGTKTWLVTYEVLEVVGGTFGLFVLILIAFYSGELVWRERDVRLAPIFDALPIPRWVYFTSKLLALMGVQVLLVVVLMVAGILLQASKGYFHFELSVYVKTLAIRLVSFWILCSLAMLIHVVVNQKYVGHFAMILYFLVAAAMPLVGLEHHLYRFDTTPIWAYSAMNGFGHWVEPIVAFELYWGTLAVAFALVANALWVRGTDVPWRLRLREAWATRSRATVVAMTVLLTLFVGEGAFIYWNTNIVNPYVTAHLIDARRAEHETKYRKWRDVPQPTIRSVKVTADIFPDQRIIDLRGTYAIENETSEPIARIVVEISHHVNVHSVSFGRGEHLSVSDKELDFYVYDLATPLAPHEKASAEFRVYYDNPGFHNGGGDTQIVFNGTFVSSSLAPHFGYNEDNEIEDDAVRHKFGLAPRSLPPAGDAFGSMHNYVTRDSNWVDFDATVSTSADQLAIAPGYLDREWTEGGRRFFHYTMDGKMLGFYSFLSARYTVLKDAWTPPGETPGPNDVAIEIDYQSGHEFNLARMVEGVKKSLDYFTANFGPYQHRKVRIAEFPRYEKFAQSFPNTIPFSESVGFIARVNDKDPDGIDYPFYVTAHEVAHQWWAHQVVGGNVQGAALLSETMAQYSALMVMKHEYGPEKMKKFLRYELDNYLRGRSGAKHAEMPLVKVEHQPYIYYSKGSLVMYALADYIGEDALNAALAEFVAKTKFQEPPYPDAPEFVAALQKAVPPEYPHLIEDLFLTITLFDNRAMKASYVKRADGKYDVSVDVRAKKMRAAELGDETEIPVDDFIDIGVLGKKGNVLALERKKISSVNATFTMTVDAEPATAGIDPLNKLIDRIPDDNTVHVEAKE